VDKINQFKGLSPQNGATYPVDLPGRY